MKESTSRFKHLAGEDTAGRFSSVRAELDRYRRLTACQVSRNPVLHIEELIGNVPIKSVAITRSFTSTSNSRPPVSLPQKRQFRIIGLLSSVQLRHCGLMSLMALVRILVDGYSLLHNWPALARGRARHSAAARDELIRRLTLYQDAIGTPVTVFFDGSQPRRAQPASEHPHHVEVLYSRAGQTADQMIERAAHRFAPYGEVLAVTDDLAERETVSSLGGLTSSCENFIQSLENTLAELADEIKSHNRQERHRFGRGGSGTRTAT